MLNNLASLQHPSIQQSLAATDQATHFQGIDFLVGGIWVSDSVGTASEEVSFSLDSSFLYATKSTLSDDNKSAVNLQGFLGVHPGTGILRLWNFTTIGVFAEATQLLPHGETVDQPRKKWHFRGMTASTTNLTWDLTLTQINQNHLSTQTTYHDSSTPEELKHYHRKIR